MKRVIKEHTAKDMRRNIDALFKRVDKHFNMASDVSTTGGGEEGGTVAAGTVMVGVWKACEEELLRYTVKMSRLIGQCYGDSGQALEYTTGDIEVGFRRHRL